MIIFSRILRTNDQVKFKGDFYEDVYTILNRI